MGGLMKGKGQSSWNVSRGRPYGLMLILAFGAAILGVMVLQKLRETRIFNLLVNEKHNQLTSLQLLLQKERAYAEGAKGKIEEMKAKMYTLQTQNMDLESRILEMQSTISSMKDEQRIIESALEEKQNEIKLLREGEMNINKEKTQVVALSETSRQEGDDIDLKQHLELPVKVVLANIDDPSNPVVNLTNQVHITHTDERWVDESVKDHGALHGSTNFRDEKSATRNSDGNEDESVKKTYESSGQSEDRREKYEKIADIRQNMGEEQSQKNGNSEEAVIGKSTDKSQGKSIENFQDGESFGVGEKKNNGNATKAIVNHGGEFLKPRNEDGEMKISDGQELGITKNVQPRKPSNSKEGESQDLRATYKGGMKLEIPNNLRGGGQRLRGKHDYVRRTKGKISRIIAKNRVFENKGNSQEREDAGMNGGRFFKDGEVEKRGRRQYDNVGLNIRIEPEQEGVESITSDKFQQGEGLNFNQVGLEHEEQKAGEESRDSSLNVTNVVVAGQVKSQNSEHEDKQLKGQGIIMEVQTERRDADKEDSESEREKLRTKMKNQMIWKPRMLKKQNQK